MVADRERLTITLRGDIVRAVDDAIDGTRIRNRSHAIEYLLTKVIGPKVYKAFILAGGKGIKMRPFTYEMPKPMIPVKGRPILEHIIDMLREHNIRDIIILVGYLGDKIKTHFGDGSKFGVKITYVEEGETSGTAQPLRKAASLLGEDPFLMIYGDVLIEINLHDLIDFHSQNDGLATIALTSVADPSDYGSVRLHGSKIVQFIEKPKIDARTSHLVSAGVHILNPEIIKFIPKKHFSMLEKDVFPQLAQQGQLGGYIFEGKWFDVGTPEVYARVIKEWKK